MKCFYQANSLNTLACEETTTQFFGQGGHTRAVKLHNLGSIHILATNSMSTPLEMVCPQTRHPLIHNTFGFMELPVGQPVGFNGECLERQSGMYALGNGYRWYSTALMRFNRADSVSPFGTGGINAYAYVQNDPVNRYDPDGHAQIGPIAVNGKMFKYNTGLKKVITFEGNFGIYKSKSGIFTKPKLFAYSHGKLNAIKVGDQALSPEGFTRWLAKNDVKVKHYKEVVLVTCLSGYTEPGMTSYAQQFSNLNNVKVSALNGLGYGYMIQGTGSEKPMLGLLSEPYAGIFPEALHDGSRGPELFPRAYDFTRFTPQRGNRTRGNG